MADTAERKKLALELWAQFSEKTHPCVELHKRAYELLSDEKFDDAARCCAESYRLGLGLGDSYVRAASRYYNGLLLFGLKEPVHWDRAEDYCEESATLFHALGERAAESVAWWSVAKIADAHTAAGYDRAQRALPAYLHILSPDAETPEQLEAQAREAFSGAVNRFGANGSASPPSPALASDPAAERKPPDPPPAPPPPTPTPTPTAQVRYVVTPVVGVPVRPLAARVFTPFEWFTLVFIFLDAILIFALAVSMMWQLLNAMPDLRVVFILLGGLLLLATLVPLAIWIGTGRLVFRGQARQAAIVRTRGNFVAAERAGWQMVVPFVEQLEAHLPLGRRLLLQRLFDIRAADGYSFLARTSVLFRVTNAAVAWSQLRQRLPRRPRMRRQIVGLEEVVSALESGQVLDDWAYALVAEALRQYAAVPAQRATLRKGAPLDRAILQLLEAQTLWLGLQFYSVEVEPYPMPL